MKKTLKSSLKKILFLFLMIPVSTCMYSQTYQWANKFGATGEQVGTRIFMDQGTGKSFSVGHFKGTVDFDPSGAIHDLTSGTGYNGYIASYTAAGALIWAKSFYSASGESYITGVVSDPSLNVYISGYFKSQMDVDPGPLETSIATGGQQYDGFIVKLNASGDLVWYKTIGTTSSDDRFRDIVLDGNNNVIVVGHSSAVTLDIDPGAGIVNITGLGAQSGLAGPNVLGVMLKLNNAGNYISHFQRANNSQGSRLTEYFFTRVKVNAVNDIFILGYKHHDDVFPGGQENYNQALLVQLSAANNTILNDDYFWANQNNSSAPLYTNIISDIEIDASGNYYLVGYFNYNIHIGNAVLTSTNLNVNKGWVAKYNSAGVAQWAKGIYQENVPTSIDLDNAGNIYIGGYHRGTVDFDLASGVACNSISLGGTDGYLFKLDNTGAFTGNLQKVAGQNDDLINDVVVKKVTGDFIITGAIQSANVDFNPGAAINTLSSIDLNDAFLAKYTPCSMPLPPVCTNTVQDLNLCSGASVTLTVADQVGLGATYNWYATATAGLPTSTGLTKTVTPTATTSYWVQASNSCGTSARTEIIVTAGGTSVTPTLSISSSSPSTVCQGVSISFSTSQTNGGTPTYQWYNNTVAILGQTGPALVTSNLPTGTNSITCVMTSNAPCRTVNTVTSNAIVISVSPYVNPTAVITAPQTTICSGASLSFTATPTNGGANPLYQWKVNNTNQGGNTSNNTFTSSSLSNGSQVYCVITSNANCLSNSAAQSNVLTITVSPNLAPTVAITATSTTICTGGSVTFNANATNAGVSPSYQWKLNNVNIGGATSSTYSTSSLTNSASITCVVTSNAICASPTTATSNAIVMNIVSSVTPALAITATQTTICLGTTVNFTAVPTNGGSVPTYQWKLNNVNIGGATSSTYSTNSLTNGASITCVMTSNNSCASPTTATSNAIVITVSSTVAPALTISASQTAICQGASIIFSSTPINGGLAPTYQWKKNNVNIGGATSATYITSSAVNGDAYSCVITSVDPCASPASATSNSVSITVNSNVTASVVISTSAITICSGVNATFTAVPTNGGASPVYQWMVNGNPVGTNSTTYSSTTLNNSDIVTCILNSNIACLANPSVTSNAITMTVNNSLVPTVSVMSAQNVICDSDTLHLYTSIFGGGTSPSYQWKLNNNNVGTNNDSINLTGLVNGDLISCVLTSILSCASPTIVTSTNFVASVLSSIGNTNVISTSSNNLCQGIDAAFVSTVSGVANSTTYQWYVNGLAINNANSNTYGYFPQNQDNVYCVITSMSACGSVIADTSNVIDMTIGATGQLAYIYINTPNTSICSSDTITFNSNAYNTGKNPAYNWLVNGTSTGITSSVFSTGSLNNGDLVQCVLVSSDACLATAIDTSNAIIIGVTQTTIPNINITTTDSIICPGQSVTFNNTYTNGGTAPILVWYLVHNGFTQVGTGASYTNTSLINNDTIVTVLVNNDYCAIPNFDMAQISMVVGIDTSVSYTTGTFTANMSGATYQWMNCGTGQIVSGATNQSFSPQTNGNYAVVIDIGGCKDTSDCHLFIITDLHESNEFSTVSVYPNPANNLVTITSLIKENFTIELIDYTGKLIYSTQFVNDKINIDISNYANGFYHLRFTSKDRVGTQKLILSK